LRREERGAIRWSYRLGFFCDTLTSQFLANSISRFR
jgi:hypothetical protein